MPTPTPYTHLPHHNRFPYSAIHQRPDYAWPNGTRLAVYLGFNIEHFAFGEGLGANLGPASPAPDVLHYTWREYGNRVGGLGAVRRIAFAYWCADQHGALRPLPGAGATTTSQP